MIVEISYFGGKCVCRHSAGQTNQNCSKVSALFKVAKVCGTKESTSFQTQENTSYEYHLRVLEKVSLSSIGENTGETTAVESTVESMRESTENVLEKVPISSTGESTYFEYLRTYLLG